MKIWLGWNGSSFLLARSWCDGWLGTKPARFSSVRPPGCIRIKVQNYPNPTRGDRPKIASHTCMVANFPTLRLIVTRRLCSENAHCMMELPPEA